MIKIKYIIIFLIVCLISIFSCIRKNSTIQAKHSDSLDLKTFNQRSFSVKGLFNEISKADIDAIPDSILKNRKTLFHFFINRFIPNIYYSNGRHPYYLDSIGYNDSSEYKFSDIFLEEGTPNPESSFEYTFGIGKGKFIGNTFGNTFNENKNYNFIKQIFNNNIYNRHYCELAFDDRCSYDEFIRINSTYDSISLYNDTVSFRFLKIERVLFSKNFTAFIIGVNMNPMYQGHRTLICTYNNDGNFIDGIETGAYSFYLWDQHYPPCFFYSYFENSHIYNICIQRVNENHKQELKQNKVYKETIRKYKYRLSKEGKFILIKKIKKEEIKTIF